MVAKYIKRGVAVVLVLALIPLFIFGAKDRDKVSVNAEDKTILRVGVYDGGLGSDWVYMIATAFEERYAEVSFEPGKKGVYVEAYDSSAFTGEFGTGGTENMEQDVIFAEGAATLYAAEKGYFLDISDVVTKPLNYDFVFETTVDDEDRESVTIESKMSQEQINYYSAIDGKYYALPSAETYMGLAYDIELFEEENLYFAPNGTFVKSIDDERSSGPDGDPTTDWDNGLPQTYEQFYKLCDKIKSLGIIPVMWGGALQEMTSFLLLSMEADYLGAEQMYLNYNFDGEMNDYIIGFDNVGNPVISEKPVTITAENGYELYKQTGKYYALKFLEGIIENKYYNTNTGFSSNFSHADAEGVFVKGKFSGERAAMLVDGNWWQNEAAGIFEDMAAEYGEEAEMETRRFGMMPFPKAHQGKLGEMTLLTYQGHIGFVNAHVDESKKALAKSFVQYCYTDKAMREYTLATNICRPMQYDMGEDYDYLTAHGKTCVDLHMSATKVSMESAAPINKNHNVDIWYAPKLWLTNVGGEGHTYPSTAIGQKGVTAEEYFKGLSTNWTPTLWSSTFKNIK